MLEGQKYWISFDIVGQSVRFGKKLKMLEVEKVHKKCQNAMILFIYFFLAMAVPEVRTGPQFILFTWM